MITREGYLHDIVCQYLRFNYPKVLFRTDFAAGVKMTMGQAVRHKKLQACRAWPDLFIAQAKQGYHGLFLELKAEGASPFLKNGQLRADTHVREQAEVLEQLKLLGYKAEFVVGFDQARETIDSYLHT